MQAGMQVFGCISLKVFRARQHLGCNTATIPCISIPFLMYPLHRFGLLSRLYGLELGRLAGLLRASVAWGARSELVLAGIGVWMLLRSRAVSLTPHAGFVDMTFNDGRRHHLHG
jgi:hypothetical protein